MDSFLVFDPRNDLILIKYNKQFSDNLNNIAENNDMRIDSEKDCNESESVRDLLILMLTPYVTAQRLIDDCSDIKFDFMHNAKAVFTFKQEFFFLYIFAETDARKYLMQRKVNIFAEIICFLFGPAIQTIKTNRVLRRLAFDMMEFWEGLNMKMTFLLESIERLLIGPDIKKLCDNTLLNIYTKFLFNKNLFPNQTTCHLYLFYGLNLVSSYTNKNISEISSRDKLLLLLLSNALNHWKITTNIELSVIKVESNSYDYNMENEMNSITNANNDNNSITNEKNALNSFNPIYNYDFNEVVIFLESDKDPNILAPHILRLITISEHLYCVVLNEQSSTFSLNLYKIIDILNKLISSPSEMRCYHTVNDIKESIKQIRNYVSKNNLSNNKRYDSTLYCLKSLKETNVFKHITDLKQTQLSFRLEAQISMISNCLRESYKAFIIDDYYKYLTNSDIMQNRFNLLNQIKSYSYKSLNDYLDYFRVKSQRNMTILGINSDTEGMLGFIYIDRTLNELIIAPLEFINDICPNKHQITDGENYILNQFYKDRDNISTIMTNMILDAYECLINGHLMSKWTDGILHYSYFMWFEDSSGNAIKPRINKFKLYSFPSVITDNFIKQIISHSFPKSNDRWPQIMLSRQTNVICYPYELFCIHKTSFVKSHSESKLVSQAKKLVSKLWEITSQT